MRIELVKRQSRRSESERKRIASLSRKGTEAWRRSLPPCVFNDGIIVLPCGRLALIDREDVAEASSRRWHLSSHGYVVAARPFVYLHRLLMKPQKSEVVDHRDGNKLDNRRENLRLCSRGNNVRNQSKRHGKFKYKGLFEKRGKFYAQLCYSGKRYKSGPFVTELEAARAYDVLALTHHCEFARLNFPSENKAR